MLTRVMPTLSITFETEEELCRLLRMTLEKLPACENLPSGQGLVRQLRAASRKLPLVSTTVQVSEPTGQPEPRSTSQTRILGRPGDFEDPLFLQAVEQTQQFIRGTRGGKDFDTIEDPFFGPNIFQDKVVVQDAKGKTSVQRRIPFDLDLLGALESEGGLISDAVIGVSRGLASLLGLGNTTVSEALARASGGDKKNVHVAIGLPVIDIIPGNALRDALVRESNIALLEGDIESLQRSVTVGKLFEGGSKKAQTVLDRNSGNLEILRIEQQEEF